MNARKSIVSEVVLDEYVNIVGINLIFNSITYIHLMYQCLFVHVFWLLFVIKYLDNSQAFMSLFYLFLYINAVTHNSSLPLTL